MGQERVRPIAICVIEDAGKLFVFEARDPATGRDYYRPLGGQIEFGELGADCVIRELREEIGAELADVTYLGLIENRFSLAGVYAHELVLVYQARLLDLHKYVGCPVQVQEGEETLVARWVPRTEFEDGTARLVPDELLELLEENNVK
jgi:8-oxo-dGTP pyrophosphatase MutT (NUDIX family)